MDYHAYPELWPPVAESACTDNKANCILGFHARAWPPLGPRSGVHPTREGDDCGSTLWGNAALLESGPDDPDDAHLGHLPARRTHQGG